VPEEAACGYIRGVDTTLTVGLRELKDRLAEYIREARRGGKVLVTDRGRPVVEIVRYGSVQGPPPTEDPHMLALAAAGRVHLASPDAEAPARLQRKFAALRKRPKGTGQRLLDEERGE
jgi:prevent-host-death family protein